MFGTCYYKCDFISVITILSKFGKGRFLDYKDLVKLAKYTFKKHAKVR